MDSRKALTPRAQEMYELIEKYFESGLQQRTFCNQIGINLTTFQKWLYYYRKDNGNTYNRDSIYFIRRAPLPENPQLRIGL